MQNSTVKINRSELFSTDNVNFNAQSASGTVTAGTTGTIDLKMLDDNFITGGMLLTNGAVFGDHVSLQVIDIDNVLGLGANTVLGQYMSSWGVRSDVNDQLQFDENLLYPAKILYGLYLRAIFVSTGANNVSVTINYKLHKALY
jgi:hypothetical protein